LPEGRGVDMEAELGIAAALLAVGVATEPDAVAIV
tara:strand:+ start:211 stop:315 length:105 start_codon:yes stop_codon:yes gene_type:complete